LKTNARALPKALPWAFKWVDCDDNPRSQLGHGVQRFRLDCKIAGIRVGPCLESDAEVSHLRGIPSLSLLLRQGIYEGAERQYGGVRGSGDLSQFEMGMEGSSGAPNIEDVHVPAEAPNERLEIIHGMDIQIDVSKISDGRINVGSSHTYS
jgi:hypothetical protein